MRDLSALIAGMTIEIVDFPMTVFESFLQTVQAIKSAHP